MSQAEVNLCSVLLKEYFGEVVQKVGTYLMKQVSSRPLRVICSQLALPLNKVRISLRVLILHNFADFCLSSAGLMEYTVKSEQVLYLLHYPRFIYSAKIVHGDAAELLVEELLNNGRMTMSKVLEKVIGRLQEAVNSDYTPEDIRDKFILLAKERFICRLQQVNFSEKGVDSSTGKPQEENELFVIPEIKLYLLGKCEDTESPAKKPKLEKFPDKGIYWKVNINRFIQHFQEQTILNAVTNYTDSKAAEIVRILFLLSDNKYCVGDVTTKPVARHEIMDTLSHQTNIDITEFDPYIGVLTEGIQSFVSKADDRSGGMYVVNIKETLQRLAEATVASVIQDRYGSKYSRICRLLLAKKYLEIKQIEQLAMISSNDAKEFVYKMLEEGFIITQEISKTPDYTATRTLFLFHIDLSQVCRMLLGRCYQAVFNIALCLEHQNKENKRLLEKKQRVDAIVSTLQQSGASEQQISEVQQVITQFEAIQLEKIRCMTEKLERSQIQLADMIVLLQLWINQLHIK